MNLIGPSIANWRTLLIRVAIIAFCIILLILPDELATGAPHKRRRSYSLRKGSRLDRHHRRSVHQWREANHPTAHRHRKHIRIHRLNLDDILRQMDSMVKPRFGK